ncbi:Vi polysaccharide biosynthesis protein TviE [Legionella busanensis]|uniref:Vi polysaccharide biosynthesis protein TviE n=1 Tax=Legionella busanensis TaxID=190655 RepID=A0A378KDQ0_9GAMM|nr:glycosyltransferase [Legionella busanensis]STX81352.1 Vi polysaccharide biosynthesis protein TviE [Legionella busanensis]
MITETSDSSNMHLNSEDKILSEAKNAYELNSDNLQLFDKYVQALIKYNQLPKAEDLISNSPLLKQNCIDSLIVHAHLLYKMKKYDDSDHMFDELVIKFPESEKLRIVYAQTLRKRRKVIKAYEVIKPIDVSKLDKKQRIIHDEIIKIINLIETKEGRPVQSSDDFSILSMKHAVLCLKEQTRKKSLPNQLGKVSLITGSLGPGGAERQVCLTAIHINKKKTHDESVLGVKINTEVDVVINVTDSEEEKIFFSSLLKEHKVNLFQIRNMPSVPIEKLNIESPTLLDLLNESPSLVRYGLNHLVQYYREAKTEVAFIWQDGAILFAAIAALVAGVPRIILNFRGYPPNLRPHLFKPEYYTLYKYLAEIHTVSFVTNTAATAKAYAEWLDISFKRFSIIYNGITPPKTEPEGQDEEMWAKFASQTSDATETIGGVFRFEADKRPILVIRFIKRYLQKHRKARFILVGEGRLRAQCMTLANELKISDRILFVGLSKSVGYWLLKMDVMILMSLYEGLPNVLIEAQYMGVPIVSTPAGGAQECFIQGETGFILNDAQEPDLLEACEKVSNIITMFKNDPELKNKAISFASTNFSISGMIEKTVSTLAGSTSQIAVEQEVCEELV